MNFDNLTEIISKTHHSLLTQATKSVNACHTLRNWLIGYQIQEYEQNGQDRAKYGKNIIEQLAIILENQAIPGCSSRRLWEYRQFYQVYPEILHSAPAELKSHINQLVEVDRILQALPAESTPYKLKSNNAGIPRLPISTLFNHLSFTHFVMLIKIEDPLKRSFYEIESVRGNWSSRELKRQIASLYYERSGLSKNKDKLSAYAHEGAHQLDAKELIRDPYVFEFLGIKPHEALRENNLRDSILDKLQEFLLEMGKGFCFEARNKRILIGDEFFFIDLVCYHRILKAHILIELKVGAFNHEHAGQLNSYLGYYKKHEMTPGDNPPIGLLLCTEKNEPLVEYTLSGISNQLFISKYQFALPGKVELKQFLEKILRE